MSALLKGHGIGAITLFTEDLDRSKAFYQEMFGLPVVFEDRIRRCSTSATVINLLEVSAARELIAPATVAGATPGSRSSDHRGR